MEQFYPPYDDQYNLIESSERRFGLENIRDNSRLRNLERTAMEDQVTLTPIGIGSRGNSRSTSTHNNIPPHISFEQGYEQIEADDAYIQNLEKKTICKYFVQLFITSIFSILLTLLILSSYRPFDNLCSNQVSENECLEIFKENWTKVYNNMLFLIILFQILLIAHFYLVRRLNNPYLILSILPIIITIFKFLTPSEKSPKFSLKSPEYLIRAILLLSIIFTVLFIIILRSLYFAIKIYKKTAILTIFSAIILFLFFVSSFNRIQTKVFFNHSVFYSKEKFDENLLQCRWSYERTYKLKPIYKNWEYFLYLLSDDDCKSSRNFKDFDGKFLGFFSLKEFLSANKINSMNELELRYKNVSPFTFKDKKSLIESESQILLNEEEIKINENFDKNLIEKIKEKKKNKNNFNKGKKILKY